jgi:hypothetical protein
MDKNKIIKLYSDFAEGKLLPYNERINFQDKLNKVKKAFKNNPPEFEIENNPSNSFVLDHNYLNGFVNPILAISLADGWAENPNPIYDLPVPVLYQITYYQAFSKNFPKNDNVYIVSDNLLNYFSSVEIPDDITLSDLRFTRELPALFIFETTNTIAYLNNYLLPSSNYTQLIASFFGFNQTTKYFPHTLVLNSQDENYHKDMKLSEYIKEQRFSDNFKNLKIQYTVLYNLLLFLTNKDTLDYKSDELNQNIILSQENIKKGNNIVRNQQILLQIPSYRFIDLELTLDNYSQEYHKKHPYSEQHSRTPHWRSAHWHTYWMGKRDGSEERKKELKFIPMTWVGNPELKTDILSFKVIK